MNGDLDLEMSKEDLNPSFLGRFRDDEFESRSLSDDDSFDAMSGDENKQEKRPKKKKKKMTKYHRHTSYQIQELES